MTGTIHPMPGSIRSYAVTTAVVLPFLALLFWSLGGGLARAEAGEAAAASNPPRQTALEGRVEAAATRRPIENVSLILLSTQGEVAQATTDATGYYRIADVEEGSYRLLIEHPGYGTTFRPDVRLVRGKVTVLDLVLAPVVVGSESVVVTAAAANDPRNPVSTTALQREDLRRSPGTAGDVFRALDSLPGVAATGEFSSFTVRGRGPRDNLILVDGLPFDKVLHFEQSLGEQEEIAGGGRYSIFAPNLIAEAEFQPGGWSAAFGGRNGSLLQLRVAEGNRETLSASLRLEIVGWEVIYDGPSYVHDKTSLLFTARDSDFERLFKAIGGETIGAPSFTDVILKTATELSPRHRLSFLGIWSPESYDRDVSNVLAADEPIDINPLIGDSSQDSGLFGVNWNALVGSSGTLTNAFFHRSSRSRVSTSESFPDQAGPNPSPEDVPVREHILNVDEGETELGWRGDYVRVGSNKGIFTAGARLTRVGLDYESFLNGDWVRYVYDENDFRPDPTQKFIVLQPQFVNNRFDDSALRAAAYVEQTFRPAERWSVTPGLRYDYDGFSGNSDWSPRLAVGRELGKRTRLHGAVGLFYQLPRFLEIAADPSNLDLKSERSAQVVFGARQILTSTLDLGIELYYQGLSDLIVVPDRTTGIATNQGEGYSAGIDLQLTRRLTGRWSAGMTYSLARSRRDDNRGEGAYDSEFNRPHVFNIFGTYELGRNWIIAAKWRYATGRPTDAFIVNDDVFNDPSFLRFSKELTEPNVNRLPDFHTLNVRVDYRRRFGPISLIAFVDIFNLYGRNNVNSEQWNELVGANREGGLEQFPTFGLKIEY